MRWTETQLETYLAKQPRADVSGDRWQDADEGPENRLQAKIVEWAKTWGKPCLSFRQSKKAQGFITPGWPDITLALAKGRVLFLELKSAKGVVEDDQKQIHLQLMALGHEVHVVRSFKRFLAIVGN
jgi:hypothetical protein